LSVWYLCSRLWQYHSSSYHIDDIIIPEEVRITCFISSIYIFSVYIKKIEVNTFHTIMNDSYSFITHWIFPTSVHINFTPLHSKYQPGHNSAIDAACCHVDVLCIDIYFSVQMFNRNETFLQVWRAKQSPDFCAGMMNGRKIMEKHRL
jgi:hypothetical protein